MNEKIKKKWLKALRSGDYKQCRNKLTSNLKSFCCLGVLCDVVYPKGWQKLPKKILNGTNSWVTYEHLGDTDVLSDKLLKKTGVDASTAAELAEMNDEGATFKEIANAIERFYPSPEKKKKRITRNI